MTWLPRFVFVVVGAAVTAGRIAASPVAAGPRQAPERPERPEPERPEPPPEPRRAPRAPQQAWHRATNRRASAPPDHRGTKPVAAEAREGTACSEYSSRPRGADSAPRWQARWQRPGRRREPQAAEE